MSRRALLTPRVLLALVIIAVGVIYTLDNLRWIEADQVLYFWPALLVVFGVVRLVSGGTGGAAVVWMLVGLVLLVPRIWPRYRPLEWARDHWPLLLIAFGLYLAFSSLFARSPRHAPRRGGDGRDDAEINAFAFLGSFKRTSTSDEFRGGDLVAVMGGCEVDLRQATIAEGEAVIEVVAVWGGIELRVPGSWSVDLRVLPMMGGAEDKTTPPAVPGGERLVVKGFAVMGGVEITN